MFVLYLDSIDAIDNKDLYYNHYYNLYYLWLMQKTRNILPPDKMAATSTPDGELHLITGVRYLV